MLLAASLSASRLNLGEAGGDAGMHSQLRYLDSSDRGGQDLAVAVQESAIHVQC